MSIRVGDDHRINELSFTPGGSEIKVLYDTGKEMIYDKVKFVDKYCSRLIANPKVMAIHVNGTFYWKR